MSYNGSGTFNINSAGQPVVSGTVISSTAFNALTADLATGLTTALTKDGQSTPTANITLGGYKITNLATGTSAADAVRFDQLTSAGVPLITIAGTANAITGTVTPSLTAYTTGDVFSFVVGSNNTSAVTLNIDGVGVKSVTRTGSVALVSGDMVAGQLVLVEYDGTRFQLLNGNSFTKLNVSGTLGVTGLTTLGVTGASFPGSTSGTAKIVAPASAGTTTFTLPATTDTLVGKATTDTLSNKTLTSPVLDTAVTGTAVATQAQQETGTATDVLVTSGRQQFHPSAIKGWAVVTMSGGTPTLATNYNITSIGDNGTGDFTITWNTDFSTANYTLCGIAGDFASGSGAYYMDISSTTTISAGAVRVNFKNSAGNNQDPPNRFSAMAAGDQS